MLAIQDTTEINLSSHYNRLDKSSGVGSLDGAYASQLGFKVHPSLVLDAFNGFPVGFSEIRLWERPLNRPGKHERDYQRQPIEEKESYKWIETSQKSKVCLAKADAVVIIQDWEGDIFEQFAQIPDEKTYLLVRSRINRNLSSEGKLWDELDKAAASGTYTVLLGSDSHSNEPARQAEIDVRFIKASVKAPTRNQTAICQTCMRSKPGKSTA